MKHGPQTRPALTGRVARALAFVLVILAAWVPALKAQSAKPDDARKLMKQAAKLTRAGSYRDAEAVLRRAVENAPLRSDAKLQLAYVLAKRQGLIEAYNLSFEIAKAEPRNAQAFAVLGYTLVAAGRFNEARQILANALKLDGDTHLAFFSFGLLDFYENKIGFSLTNLESAVFYAPQEPDYWFAKAQVSARAERYKESAEAYRNFLHYSDTADVDRRERIKGLISFLRILGEVHQLYVPDGKGQTNVGFELESDRPVITLRVNNRPEPLRFVLDTGSGISVMSEETAKRLKIKPVARGGHARGLGGDGKFAIVYGMLREVAIGDVNIKNVPIYIRKFHDDAQKVDGYIGLSLISKFLATIDYGTRTFSLTRKDADTRQFREENAVSLPLRLTSSGFLSGEVELEGIDSTLNFIVDTGASISVISDRVARIDQVSRYVNAEKLRVIGSAGITDDMPTFILPRVTFGKNTRRSVMAVALDLDIINEASGFEQAGILGGNFLKNYRLTFDFKNSKVVFEPIPSIE
jgi:tetratricopeptide (TPR) repeat protein/predicted aspartyl protease